MRIDDVGGSNITRPAPAPSATPPAQPTSTTSTRATSTPSATASAMVQQATPKGAVRPDVQLLAAATKAAAVVNPQAAPIIQAQIAATLRPVEYGQYMRAMDKLENASDRRDIDGDGSVTLSEAIATWRADRFNALGREVPVKHLHLNDPGYQGIPQGQGYDRKTNEFLTTYYAKTDDDKGTDVRLSIQDKYTGYETAYVNLKGKKGEELTHGGGVAVSGKWVFVSDDTNVYTYDRAKIAAAKPGADIKAEKVSKTELGSFLNVSPDGKYAYVGKFAEDVPGKEGNTPQTGIMYRFEVNQKTGKLVNQSSLQIIPDNAQGVAVTDKGLIFTTSFGSDDDWSPKELHFLKFETSPSKGFKLQDPSSDAVIGEIDYYAEGINVIGDDLYITYESGAEAYKKKTDVNHESIQKYSLDDFDLPK